LRGLQRQFHSANFFIHHFWLCLLDSGIACLMMECLKSTFTTKSHLKKVFFTEKATLSSTIFWYFLCTFVDFCRILLACKIVLEFVWFACTCVEQVDFAAWVFTFLSARCSWCKWEDVRTVSWPAAELIEFRWPARGQLTLVEQVSQSNCWYNSGRDFVHAGRVASICVTGTDLCVVFF